jgi:2Fe-2S ferredoxin
MPTVTFLVEDQSYVCNAEPGQTLLEVALENDVPIQHSCGGNCLCTTCRVEVIDGLDALTPVASGEGIKLARFEGGEALSRLSCQACVEGEVTVNVMNIA